MTCSGAAVDGSSLCGEDLQRLAAAKVFRPTEDRGPAHDTVVVFDWDDTLLCTTFLNRFDTLQELQAVDEARLPLIGKIGDIAKVLLEEAMKVGRVFIVTNSEEGWVQHSATRWVPALLPVLEQVTVVSARSRYERLFPDEIGKWKIMAFLDLQKEIGSAVISNLISLGDSDFEVEAAQVMKRELRSSFIKIVRFRECPTPEELLKQLELVKQQFRRIAMSARCLKISLCKMPSTGAPCPAPAAGAPASPAEALAVA